MFKIRRGVGAANETALEDVIRLVIGVVCNSMPFLTYEGGR